MAARGNPYRRLRSEMLLVLLAFGLVPVLAMALAGFAATREALETRTRNVLEAMVKNRRATVELFLEEKQRSLELLAEALPVARLADETVLEALLAQMRQERGGIVDLGVIDQEGHHLAYVGPYNLRDRDYHEQPWFQQVMVRGRYESDVFLGFRRFPHMVLAVKKREAGRDFILRATVDTDLLSDLVREGGLESGADVFILNRSGEYQTRYSDEHRLMEKADLWPVPVHSGARVAEQRRGSGREFLATAWLRDDSWVLVARQPAPGIAAIVAAHPGALAVFVAWLVALPVLSRLVARHRLRQMREIEGERAALFESAAQSQKMAAVGRLAAGVAHEINNPLAIIDAQVGVLSDILDERPALSEASEFRERLRKIEAQVTRARKVTHRLLGFSRRVGPDREPVDLAAALDETVGFVEREAEAASIRIVRDFAPDLPIIRSSLSQIQQVFLNLINNAMDAIGRGGELRLTTRRDGDGVAVQVHDDGPGIPERDLGRIFDPFYSTKSEGGKHSGLGLPICREIVSTLGGRLTVESEAGEGTTFTLWLPVESDA